MLPKLSRTFCGLAIVVAGFVSPASAAVLNFDDLVLPNFGVIPGNYGSGLDSQIAVSYRTYGVPSDATESNNLFFWNLDYGDLVSVAFAQNTFSGAEIIFTPNPGFGVVLGAFDLAAWVQPGTVPVDRLVSKLEVLDDLGNSLLTQTNFFAPAIGHSTFSTFSNGGLSEGALRIRFENNWNVGIDNISFRSVPVQIRPIPNPNPSPVPEPATMSLLGVFGAFAGLRLARRRVSARS